MEAVVVNIDAIMDVDAVDPDALALDHADAVKRAAEQAEVADDEVFAAVEQEVVGALGAANAARRRGTIFPVIVELLALAIDRARPLHRDVPGLDGEEERPVAVTERGITAQRNRVYGV